MQENNMSVFGTVKSTMPVRSPGWVLRRRSITTIPRRVHKLLSTLMRPPCTPWTFRPGTRYWSRRERSCAAITTAAWSSRPPSIPSPRLTSTRPSWTSTATGSATRAGSAWWRRWSASAPPTPSSRPAGCPATTTRWRRTSCSRASRCGSSTGSTAA